jgi:DNA primase
VLRKWLSMISKDTIALVRDRTDIVAVVSESVPSLKKRGRRFVGLCPFHKEKTPSFNVNPDSGLYHCFGCKESGDVFTFLERAEGYTFGEAVRVLAERAGIPIERTRPPAQSDADRHKKEREALYGVMQMAAVWYEEQLREHPQRSYALDELARRGLPRQRRGAGLSHRLRPAGVGRAGHFLKKQGVSPATAESVGLLVPRSSGSGYYDRFRHRLMFAVIDAHGRVVAFSGRALRSHPGRRRFSRPAAEVHQLAREPDLHQRGNALRPLAGAARHPQEGAGDPGRGQLRRRQPARARRRQRRRSARHGVHVDQAKLLRRYAVDVTLLFDGDAAGRKAAVAAEEPCEVAGSTRKSRSCPRDRPDEFVRTKGEEALRHIA